MKSPKNTPIVAALIAVAAGLASWFTGLSRAMWPPHPLLGSLLITVFLGIVTTQLYPAIMNKLNR